MAGFSVADGEYDHDRQAEYVGTALEDHGLNDSCGDQFGRCPFILPRDVMAGTCDESGGFVDSGVNGVGGVLFCNVVVAETVTIVVDDWILDTPKATIACPVWVGGAWIPEASPPVVWHLEDFIQANPSATFQVPGYCAGGEIPYDGLTSLAVFVHTGHGVSGTVELIHN